MLRFLYNLFFPATSVNVENKELMSCNVELENNREEIMSCKEELITTYECPKPTFQTENEILDLIKHFEEKTLPVHEWTHEAHLIVAAYYLKSYTWEEAQTRLRSSIKSYNDAVGIINSPTSGYHETITIFWLHLVKRFIEMPVDNFLSICSIFRFMNKNKILEFYSYDLIQSTEARQNWVEPDKKALDFSERI